MCFSPTLLYFRPDEQADDIPRNTLARSKSFNQMNTFSMFIKTNIFNRTHPSLGLFYFYFLARWYGEPKLAQKRVELNIQKISKFKKKKKNA